MIISLLIKAKKGLVIYAEIIIIATFIKLFETKIVAKSFSGLFNSFNMVFDNDVFARVSFLLSLGGSPKNATSLPDTIADININNINTDIPIKIVKSIEVLLILFKNTKYLKGSDSKIGEIIVKKVNRLYRYHQC